MRRLMKSLSVACVLCVLLGNLFAKAHPVIVQARSYLGSESALNSVQNVKFKMTLFDSDKAEVENSICTFQNLRCSEWKESMIRETITIATNGLEGFNIVESSEEKYS